MTKTRCVSVGISLACAGILLLGAAACSRIGGSGKVVTESISISSFSKLQVGSAFEVTVSFGDQEALTLHVDDNLTGHVDAGASSGTLHIGLKPRTSVHDATLKADVIARNLTSIELSGAAQVHFSNEASGRSIKLTASGAGRLDGSFRMDEVELSLSGASNAKLSGNVARLVVSGSGASQLDALDLQSTDLEISLSGASEATVSVSGTIAAVVSGASTLRYKGSPRFTKRDASGASDIESI
jgi:hypothetical protein